MPDVDRLAAVSDRTFVRVLVHGRTADAVLSKRDWDNGCVFLDPERGRCTVYESRPLACRLFPFGLSRDPLPSGGAAAVELDGTRYELIAFKACPRVGTGERVELADIVRLSRESQAADAREREEERRRSGPGCGAGG
jgi:Fe-S-cluster containining protein